MHQTEGLLAALVALLAWGFGDYIIQKSTRIIGAIPTLFYISLIGSVGLLPLVWHRIPELAKTTHILPLLAWTVFIAATYSILLLEAFRRGKLSVIEPVASFELPLTIIIGLIIIGETVTSMQLWLIILVFIGLLVTVLRRDPQHWWNIFRHRTFLEQGVIIAIIGTVAAAFTNVLTGVLSRRTDPLLAIWGVDIILTTLCFIWIAYRGQLKSTFSLTREHWPPVIFQGIFDNAAWVAYAYAVTKIPISITIAITECYIALAALLGVMLNREKLDRHQYYGIAISLIAVVLLAIVSA
ncbi:MAG: EamA family transporter [Patescibacteria group bacterium]